MKWLTSDEAIHIGLDVVRVYLEGDRSPLDEGSSRGTFLPS
jgi:hypothetical protein